jgi:ParB/RepB/Spo0J family partition protein
MKQQVIKELDINLIDENSWNPNQMSDSKFNKLTEEIETMGFLDPIQVVPMPNGRYRILGGAHRYNACVIMGYEKVPAVIMDDPKFQDEDLQKFLTLRLNLIKGKMTRDKFTKLYEDLASRHGEDFIRDSMALIDKNEWEKLKKELVKNLKDSLPKDSPLLDNFDDTVKELKTLDDITKLLESVFKQKDTGAVGTKILAFGGGGGKVVYFNVDDEIWQQMMELVKLADIREVKFNDMLEKLIK